MSPTSSADAMMSAIRSATASNLARTGVGQQHPAVRRRDAAVDHRVAEEGLVIPPDSDELARRGPGVGLVVEDGHRRAEAPQVHRAGASPRECDRPSSAAPSRLASRPPRSPARSPIRRARRAPRAPPDPCRRGCCAARRSRSRSRPRYPHPDRDVAVDAPAPGSGPRRCRAGRWCSRRGRRTSAGLRAADTRRAR